MLVTTLTWNRRVTATKREKTLNRLTKAFSALSGEQLKQSTLPTMTISRAVPGISFNSEAASEGLNQRDYPRCQLAIRSATVGTYLDDVITRQEFLRRFERTQIVDWIASKCCADLRELSGCELDGRHDPICDQTSGSSGVSSEVSADLSDTKHGSINLSGGAIVNAPIIPDVFAIRASAGYTYDSGYIDRYTQAGQLDRKGVNGSAPWRPHHRKDCIRR